MNVAKDIYHSLQMDSKSSYLNSFLAELDKKFEAAIPGEALSWP